MLSSYFLTLVDAGVIRTFPSPSAVAGEMWGIRGRLLRDDRGDWDWDWEKGDSVT